MSSKSLCIAIETASRVSSVAVLDGDRFTELNQNSQMTHSQTLLPQLKEVLELSKVDRGSVELIAVSIGPGSFTGLRIGLATAKALSYAWGVPLIGVPTLEALAYHFPFDNVLTMIDAQKNRAYCQRFERLRAIGDIKVRSVEEIMEEVSASGDKVIVCGDAISKIKEAPSNVEAAPINLRMPRAVNVGLCARRRMVEGLIDNVMNLEPLYVRRSEAEVLWEKRHPSFDK